MSETHSHTQKDKSVTSAFQLKKKYNKVHIKNNQTYW